MIKIFRLLPVDKYRKCRKRERMSRLSVKAANTDTTMLLFV